MAKPAARIAALQLVLGAAYVLVVGRAAHLHSSAAMNSPRRRARNAHVRGRSTRAGHHRRPQRCSARRIPIQIPPGHRTGSGAGHGADQAARGPEPHSRGTPWVPRARFSALVCTPRPLHRYSDRCRIRRLRGIYPEEIFLRAYPEEGLAVAREALAGREAGVRARALPRHTPGGDARPDGRPQGPHRATVACAPHSRAGWRRGTTWCSRSTPSCRPSPSTVDVRGAARVRR